MQTRITADLDKMIALAAGLGIDTGPRDKAVFIAYSNAADYGLKYSLAGKRHELFLTSRPRGVTLMHIIHGYNSEGIACNERHYRPISAERLNSVGMLVPDENETI